MQDIQDIQINEQFNTLKGLPWFNPKKAYLKRVSVFGAGGIGSWLTLFLSRAGFEVTVYDFDKVEKRNLGGQFFSVENIGQLKVHALADNIGKFSTTNPIVCRPTRIGTSVSWSLSCTFVAFDNMEARKAVFDSWKIGFDRPKSIFIDGRLEAEFLQIFCVRGDDPEQIEKYEKTLSVAEDPSNSAHMCSIKQTSHVAAMIGSFMTSFYTNFVANRIEGVESRYVPFKFEIFTPLVAVRDYGTEQ